MATSSTAGVSTVFPSGAISAGLPLVIMCLNFVKSMSPMMLPTAGMITSDTSDFTTVANAPPMMMPTAMSTRLPLKANSLNCFNIILFVFVVVVVEGCLRSL